MRRGWLANAGCFRCATPCWYNAGAPTSLHSQQRPGEGRRAPIEAAHRAIKRNLHTEGCIGTLVAPEAQGGGRVDVIDRIFAPDQQVSPDRIAVIEGLGRSEKLIDFGAFRTRARSLASAITKACSASDRVAVLLPQSADAYAAEIASLYCGRTFCPLDPSHPVERIHYCLGDLSPGVIITDSNGVERTRELGIATLVIDEVDDKPLATTSICDQAYIIYTSGSTGRPKGVCVSRRSMNKFLAWSWQFYSVETEQRWAQFSSLGFDLSLVDLLTCIPSGGTLVPVVGKDRLLPARFIQRHGISIWHSVPSVIPMILAEIDKAAEQLRSLRIASFCGEPLYPQQASRMLTQVPHAKLVNTYGPTEGTFFCSAQVVDAQICSESSQRSLPIGLPIPGWSFEFLPHEDLPLDELVIVSEYLADGYISDTPDARRFSTNVSGMPSYRTGDLVQRQGQHVFFTQRADSQVKIRGNRLDLTEVEYQAYQLGVREVKAFVGAGSLYIAVAAGSVSTAQLRSHFEKTLPGYAVPTDIFLLSALPRNANGKIDSDALRKIAAEKWSKKNA